MVPPLEVPFLFFRPPPGGRMAAPFREVYETFSARKLRTMERSVYSLITRVF